MVKAIFSFRRDELDGREDFSLEHNILKYRQHVKRVTKYKIIYHEHITYKGYIGHGDNETIILTRMSYNHVNLLYII